MAAASQKGLLLLLLPLLMLCSHSLAANSFLAQGGPAVNSSAVLVSPNGLFTLGFQQFESVQSNGSYLGIWYNDTAFFCWIVNRNFPIPDDTGSLSLDQNGTLKLTYSGGLAVELYSSSDSRRGLVAVLEDTGRFTVRDSDGNSLWQSFDSPADAWTPGMKLGLVKGREYRKLTSFLADSIPSEAAGAFTLEWDPTEEELVMKRRGVVYWTSGKQLGPARFRNADFRFTTVEYNVTHVATPEENYLTFTVSTGDYISPGNRQNFTALRLTYDGGIQDQSSDMAVLEPTTCDGNNVENGCRRWEGPACRRRNGHRFQQRWGVVKSPKQVVDDKANNQSFSSVGDCKDLVWRNCQYGGTTADGSEDGNGGTGCAVFSYGDFETAIPAGQLANGYYIIVSEGDRVPQADDPGLLDGADDPPTTNVTRAISEGAAKNKWLWGLVALACALAMVVICIFWYLRRRKLKERLLAELMESDMLSEMNKTKDDSNKLGHDHLKMYNIVTIMTATSNFSLSNKLGQGGFGLVYKGVLPEQQEVAVKRLSKRSTQGLVEFKNELVLIAKLQHTNLVRLLGCCIHGEEKILVYEYMPNKSLDSFIFDESKRSLLDWNKRFAIIEGIAQGLLYLHKYSRVRVVHRDLKLSNILLDENMNLKISDFGMARIFNTTTMEANTNKVVGTYGYMSPEYAMDGTFSTKSDVFSFGVMLLEIVSGKRNNGLIHLDHPVNLVGYAWKLWNEGTPLQLMDHTLKGTCNCMDQVLRCIKVGLLCIEYNAHDRPEISEVASMLTSEDVEFPTPKQPAFTMTRPRSVGTKRCSATNNKLEICSNNEVTITTMSAR